MKKLHELAGLFLNEEHPRVEKLKEGVAFIWRKHKPASEPEPTLRRTCSESVLSNSVLKRFGNTDDGDRTDILARVNKPRTLKRTVKVKRSPVNATDVGALPVKSCLRYEQRKESDSSKQVSFSPYALILSAASQNAISELQEFLDKKPSYINKPSSSGETALHKAAAKGYLDCIKLLIERGANANVVDKQGRTPLLVAWENGHLECHKYMLKSLK